MLALAAIFHPRRAIVIGLTAGWLLLPSVTLAIPGFIDFDKRISMAIGGVVVAVFFDFPRVARFRRSWSDLPVLLWCLCSFPSALSNDLGLYDGLATSLREILVWGIPWILGRLYLADLRGLRLLCAATFVGGVLYAPLCLWEIRMSPSLHAAVYGESTYAGVTYADLGSFGSRPSVFMRNPLELGMFLTAACLCGWGLILAGNRRSLWGFPSGFLLGILAIVAILSKNLGATALLGFAAAVLAIALRRRSFSPLIATAMIFPTYLAIRTTRIWSGDQIVAVATSIHKDRGKSFAFRLINEEMLADKALEHPLFGWGGWGRSRVYDEEGQDVTIPDGLWIITLGTNGLFGLSALTLFFMTPVLTCARRIPRRLLSGQWVPIVLTHLAIWVVVALDCLVNNFPSPLAILAAGGLCSLPDMRRMRIDGPRKRSPAGPRKTFQPLPR
jgi:hypothetical protein